MNQDYLDRNPDDNRRESQEKEARSFLRDEFLNILFTLTNLPIKIQFSKSKKYKTAIFAGSDFSFSNITLKELNTPIGQEPYSIIRLNDITDFVFEFNS